MLSSKHAEISQNPHSLFLSQNEFSFYNIFNSSTCLLALLIRMEICVWVLGMIAPISRRGSRIILL